NVRTRSDSYRSSRRLSSFHSRESGPCEWQEYCIHLSESTSTKSRTAGRSGQAWEYCAIDEPKINTKSYGRSRTALPTRSDMLWERKNAVLNGCLRSKAKTARTRLPNGEIGSA